jgi:hypothetical protein
VNIIYRGPSTPSQCEQVRGQFDSADPGDVPARRADLPLDYKKWVKKKIKI